MSTCKYCLNHVVWIQKPSGAWFPPFDEPTELANLQYTMAWDEVSGGWIAHPDVDSDFKVMLSQHTCVEYQTYLESRRNQVVRLPVDFDTVDLDEIKPEVEVRTIYREEPIDHRKAEKLAKKMSEPCPVCMVSAFEWCIYITGLRKGEETTSLHMKRGL